MRRSILNRVVSPVLREWWKRGIGTSIWNGFTSTKRKKKKKKKKKFCHEQITLFFILSFPKWCVFAKNATIFCIHVKTRKGNASNLRANHLVLTWKEILLNRVCSSTIWSRIQRKYRTVSSLYAYFFFWSFLIWFIGYLFLGLAWKLLIRMLTKILRCNDQPM